MTVRDIEGEIYARRKALADLMHSQVLGQGDVSRAFKQITETAARGAGGRARQRLAPGRQRRARIECIDLYEQSQQRHSAGVRISAADVPRYFEALQRERAIRAHDARTDKRTSEFRKGYLEPLGITSMLDAPVFLRGKMVGVVCHEHTGRPRRWKLHEELLASSFADFVALVLETAAWHEAEDALRVERDALETKVAERTRDLQESEANLRALVDFSPVAMVLTRTRRQHGAAGEPAGGARCSRCRCTEIVGRHAPAALGQPGRARPLPGPRPPPRAHRRLRGADATSKGQTFWASLSGQRLRYRRRGRAARGDRRRDGAAADARGPAEQATHDPLTGVFNRRQSKTCCGRRSTGPSGTRARSRSR